MRWQNFRSLSDSGWLDLEPLTIICGRNNTGKTSVYQPLLIASQTWQARSTSPVLVLRGEMVNAGSFRDIVFRHDTKRRMNRAG